MDQGVTVLDSISFEAGGEASNQGKPVVLSCGGIYVPRRRIPAEMASWKQIVNLPGNDLSAKIFGFAPAPQAANKTLDLIFRKELLN